MHALHRSKSATAGNVLDEREMIGRTERNYSEKEHLTPIPSPAKLERGAR